MKDVKTEEVVIGTILLSPNYFLDAIELIDRSSFSDTKCAGLFLAIESLFDQAEDVTPQTVASEYHRQTGNEIDAVSYTLKGNAGSAFIEHCLILKERQLQRMQAELAINLSSKANDPKVDPLETNEFLMSEAERISTTIVLSKPKTNAELIKAVTDKIDAASKFNGITGVRTGFKDLDYVYGGRQKTDLIIKAGRPAMGKTAQALCEAKNMAIDNGQNVLFFSLEMGAEQLMQRLVSIQTGIPLKHIRQGIMTQSDWEIYYRETDALRSDRLTIVDDVYSLTGIKTTAKKMKMRGKVDAVYIDYLQLIEHRVGGRNKENEVSEISRSLKLLAKQLDVPVIALSQLSRAVETRGGDHKPKLSDLRDSGAIEQDADIVEFLYRPEYYNPEQTELENKAFIIISKNRNGACKDIEFYFNKECTRFENVTYDMQEPVTIPTRDDKVPF